MDTQENALMDFGPNLFGGEEADPTKDETDDTPVSTNADLPKGSSIEGDHDRGPFDQVLSELTNTETGSKPTPTPEPEKQRITKSELGSKCLASAKAAVKLFESINSFDVQSANQRTIVRDLITKQSESMEFKLQGNKPPEGYDFEVIAKQLRRENNRLDTLLEGKEALFEKSKKQAELAIECLQNVLTELYRLEEEG